MTFFSGDLWEQELNHVALTLDQVTAWKRNTVLEDLWFAEIIEHVQYDVICLKKRVKMGQFNVVPSSDLKIENLEWGPVFLCKSHLTCQVLHRPKEGYKWYTDECNSIICISYLFWILQQLLRIKGYQLLVPSPGSSSSLKTACYFSLCNLDTVSGWHIIPSMNVCWQKRISNKHL